MPTFYNPDRKYFLTTNYKVLYSSLSRQTSLRKASRSMELLNNSLKSIAPKLSRKHYLLVRNPYDRIESFYKNKFIKDTQQIIHNAEDLRASQRIFLDDLGLTMKDPIEQIREKLLATSFDECMEILPRVYKKDPHLWLQSDKVNQRVRKSIKVHFTYDKVLKLEDVQTKEFLSHELGIDLSIRENTTSSQQPIQWHPDTREIINRLYQEDFQRFDYPIIEP